MDEPHIETTTLPPSKVVNEEVALSRLRAAATAYANALSTGNSKAVGTAITTLLEASVVYKDATAGSLVGWKCYESYCLVIKKVNGKLIPVLTLGGLSEGDWVQVPFFNGPREARVIQVSGGKATAQDRDGDLSWSLSYQEEVQGAGDLAWVCLGACNMKAIRKLSLA